MSEGLDLSSSTNAQQADALTPVETLSRFAGIRAALGSFVFVASNLVTAIRVCGAWLLVLNLLPQVAVEIWAASSGPTSYLIADGLELATALLFLLACPCIAVAWHRFVLRGQIVGLMPLPGAAALLYGLFAAVSFLVVVGLPLSVVMVFFPVVSETGASSLGVGWVLAVVALLYFAVRFGLVFPALAVGDEDTTLRRSWRETAGAKRGLFTGTLIIAVLAIAALALLFLAIRDVSVSDRLASAAVLLAAFTAAFYFVMVYATFLSRAYRATMDPIAHIDATFA